MCNSFSNLKEKARESLEKAIKEKEQLIKQLKKEFDSLDRFKPGNFIVSGKGYCLADTRGYLLIVGDPIFEGTDALIPVRHHIKINVTPQGFHMNMSGVIDMARVSISEMDKVTVIGLRDVLVIERNNLEQQIEDASKSIDSQILECQNTIEKKKETLNRLWKQRQEYENFSFWSNFKKFMEDYENSEEFKNYAFNNDKKDYCMMKSYTINLR